MQTRSFCCVICAALCWLALGCGVKGDPLPPERTGRLGPTTEGVAGDEAVPKRKAPGQTSEGNRQ